MKLVEFKNKNEHDLENILLGFYREQFNLRMQFFSGKLKKVHLLRKVRKNISRLKTFLTHKVV